MSQKRHLLLLLAAMLSSLSCQQPQAGPGPAEAVRPANWAVPLAKVPPALTAPVNITDADAVGPKALEIVEQAEARLAEGQFSQAAGRFQAARKLVPDSPRILRGLGLAYAGSGDHDKAEPLLRQSAEKAPDRMKIQVILGRYAASRGDLAAASTHFRKALLCSDARDNSPDAAEAMLQLATALEKRGFWTAASECYERLSSQLSADPRAFDGHPSLRTLVRRPEQLLLARGQLLLRLGQVEKAADLLERAYRRHKTYGQAAPLAVRALLAKGDFTKAQAIVLEMLKIPALRGAAVDSAVRLCKAKKDPKLPQQLLKACLDRAESHPDFVIAMAEAAADLGAGQAATDMLARHLDVAPQGQMAIRLARFYARRGKPAAAVAEYAKLLARDELSLDQLRRELALLARRPVEKQFISQVADSSAQQQDQLAAATLCVAGALAHSIGDTDLARGLLERALKNHPRFWPTYEALQELYADLEDFAALETLADQATKAAGDNHFKFYLLGKIYLDRQKIGQALQQLEEARSRRGGHVPTLLLLGRAYRRQRNLRDAERRLLAAMALAPDNFTVANELFELYIQRRGHVEAGRVVARFLRDNPQSVSGRLLAARYYLLVKRPQSARELINKLLEVADEDVEVRLFQLRMELPEYLSENTLSNNQAKAALKRIRDILKLDPNNLPARKLQGAVLGARGRHAEAAQALEKAYRQRPHDAILAGAYLNELIEAGKQDLAAGEIDQIAARKHLGTTMRVILLSALAEMKRYEKAEAFLAKWLENPANNTELAVLRLQALTLHEQAKHYDAAGELLDRWIASGLEPERITWLRIQKLRMWALAGKFDELLRHARKRIAKDPAEEDLHSAAVILLSRHKQHAEALKLAEDWLAQAQKIAPATTTAGAVKTTAPAAAAKRAQVMALIGADQKPQALARARAYVKAEPDNIDLLRTLMVALQAAEQEQEYLALMERIYKLNPNDPGINNDLGYSWSDSGINLKKAESMIRKAVAARPWVIAFQDSLGWVLYKQAKFDDAHRIFQLAAQADDQLLHAIILDHAGDTCWRLALKDRAIEMWTRAVDLAKKQEIQDAETKKVLAETPNKIQAAKAGRKPAVAPLGQGVAGPGP